MPSIWALERTKHIYINPLLQTMMKPYRLDTKLRKEVEFLMPPIKLEGICMLDFTTPVLPT